MFEGGGGGGDVGGDVGRCMHVNIRNLPRGFSMRGPRHGYLCSKYPVTCYYWKFLTQLDVTSTNHGRLACHIVFICVPLPFSLFIVDVGNFLHNPTDLQYHCKCSSSGSCEAV